MKITVTEHQHQIIIVGLQGNLDTFSVQQVNDCFDRLLDKGTIRFIVDLSKISFLDSTGMALLIRLLKSTQKAEGDVKLVWPKSKATQQIINLTRLNLAFEMDYTAEALLENFNNHASG